MISAEGAQASMEYLLLLAAVIFFFSAVLLLFQQAQAVSLFALDVSNARNFANDLKLKAGEMRFLADGSAFSVEAKPIGEWAISSDGNELFIKVKSPQLRKEKIFTVEFPNAIQFSETSVGNGTTLLLRKENGTVLLENR